MTVLTDSGLRRLFSSAMVTMQRSLRAERYLILYDEEGAGTMTVQEAAGLDPTEFWVRAPVSLTLLEKLRSSATPWLAADLQSDPEMQESSSLLLSGIRSVISAPLLDDQQRVRGLLYADHCGRPEAFSRADLARLTTLTRELEATLWSRPAPPTPRPLPAPPPRRPVPAPVLPAATPAGKSGGPISGRSLTLFFRSLSVMVATGIPLPRALHVMEGQADEPNLGRACHQARLTLERGNPLATCLQGASPSFSAFQIRLIKVGERTGGLVRVLSQLADYEERRQALSLRLRAALTYPAFLLTACLAMLVLGPPFLLKGQLRMIELAGGELPWITRALYAATDLRVLGSLALAALLIGAALKRWVATPPGALALDRFMLRMPGPRRLWRLIAITRFCQALALQLEVGLSVLEAVPQAAEASGSPVLAGRAGVSLTALREGANLTESLDAADYFPRSFLSTLNAGEESGQVSQSLQWISRLYQQELEASLEMAVAALEPTIMLVMGLATGLVALATMLPMVKVVQSL